MSDQTDSQVANEDTEGTQPEISQKQSGETQSGNSLAGDALVQAALNDPEAREALRRQFQSDKDKGVEDVKKQLKELQERLEGNSQPPSGEKKVEEAAPQASDLNITAIKQAYPDIKLDDPDVMPKISAFITNKDEGGLLAELGRIRMARLNKPKPTAASVTPPAGATITASEPQEIQAQIDALIGDREEMLKPSGRKKLKELRKKQQELEQV